MSNLLDLLGNDKFSNFNGITKEQVLKNINESLLEYRNLLFIPDDITFGTELEFDNCEIKVVKKQLSKYNLKGSWQTKDEPSIKTGGEVVSPILTNTEESWVNLKKVCDILKIKAANTDLCSAHVHVGRNILGENIKTFENFIYLWSAYEHIIFRFCYGEFLSPRQNISGFATPTRTRFQKIYNDSISKNYTLAKLLEELSFKRELAVNFKNVDLDLKKENKNTIEFRCPNGTFNEVVWQNNINLFVHLLMYAKSENFDLDKIKYQNKKMALLSSNIAYYNEVYLEDAITLCDLIFDKNIDKMYFLRQYIKNYKTSYEFLAPAKTFTK